ncbi:hypothetical protein [Dyella nitratireducens]|uniref:DUF2127 domain-containing protein n=1 Tax=Dyella nitratireducens TaxID=1849580 RepID=A0ABQ1FTU5_9GAMM|nr:hypothetical protein [Dyella nitratireducens]GGA29490.1 hypothetical protein GCM10010981_18030 [Dyella nitratireducens]GLQ43132.1 hypothetical protein GCM10007902_29820 [Dyella nitratireducens]
MNGGKPEKPIEVRQGITALWIAVGINEVDALVNTLIFRIQTGLTWVVIEVTISILLSWFFLHRIARGRSWARATYLTIKTLSIGVMFNISETWWQTSPLFVVIDWVALFITFYGAYLLFTYPSDRWFEAMSARVPLAEN